MPPRYSLLLLLHPPLPSSAVYVEAFLLLWHSPLLPACHSRSGWTQSNSAALASKSRTFLLISDSLESNLCRLYAGGLQTLQRLLYATKWTTMTAAIAVAPWRAFASIADIVNSRPALQFAVAVLVESSWRHGVELQRAGHMESRTFGRHMHQRQAPRCASHSNKPHCEID